MLYDKFALLNGMSGTFCFFLNPLGIADLAQHDFVFIFCIILFSIS